MVDDWIRCPADADGFGAARDARRSDPTASKPWNLWPKIGQHLFFHVAIQRNGPARYFLAAALDS